jgi:hypothetical protein
MNRPWNLTHEPQTPGIFGEKQYGPWPWAPWLTSFVTPTFFGFLVSCCPVVETSPKPCVSLYSPRNEDMNSKP